MFSFVNFLKDCTGSKRSFSFGCIATISGLTKRRECGPQFVVLFNFVLKLSVRHNNLPSDFERESIRNLGWTHFVRDHDLVINFYVTETKSLPGTPPLTCTPFLVTENNVTQTSLPSNLNRVSHMTWCDTFVTLSVLSVEYHLRNIARDVMRFRWKRVRVSGKRLLYFSCFAIFIIIVYRVIGEDGNVFEKDWTCEELRANDRLKQLVSTISEYWV